MAALMNQSMAAMMHPFALPGLQAQAPNHRQHQTAVSSLNYFGVPPFPNESLRHYYHAQSGHAVSITVIH